MRKPWAWTVVAAIVVLGGGIARADDSRTELGATFVVASQNEDMESAGYPGGQLELAHHHGPIGVVAEVVSHGFTFEGGAEWAALAARLAFASWSGMTRHRDRLMPARID